jgi:hypothetical protein
MKRLVCLTTEVIYECACAHKGEQFFTHKAVKNREQFDYIYIYGFLKKVYTTFPKTCDPFHNFGVKRVT